MGAGHHDVRGVAARPVGDQVVAGRAVVAEGLQRGGVAGGVQLGLHVVDRGLVAGAAVGAVAAVGGGYRLELGEVGLDVGHRDVGGGGRCRRGGDGRRGGRGRGRGQQGGREGDDGGGGQGGSAQAGSPRGALGQWRLRYLMGQNGSAPLRGRRWGIEGVWGRPHRKVDATMMIGGSSGPRQEEAGRTAVVSRPPPGGPGCGGARRGRARRRRGCRC